MTGQDFQDRLNTIARDLQTISKGQFYRRDIKLPIQNVSENYVELQ